jgi:hypothetical protein
MQDNPRGKFDPKEFTDKHFWVIDVVIGFPLFLASLTAGIWYYYEHKEHEDAAAHVKLIVLGLCALGPPTWFWIERWLHRCVGTGDARIESLQASQKSATAFWAGLLVFLGVCFEVFTH